MNLARLRALLALFFLALAIPAGALVWQAYRQLKWEALHQYQGLAEEVAVRIDSRLSELVAAEEARAFTDYAFLAVAGDPAAGFVQRSALSGFPPAGDIPGLIGYFQVDADGIFASPLLPPEGTDAAAWGVPAAELAERRALAERMQRILAENRLLRPELPPLEQIVQSAVPIEERVAAASSQRRYSSSHAGPQAPDEDAQAAFDRLSSESAQMAIRDAIRFTEKEERAMAERADDSGTPVPAATPAAPARGSRKEQNVLPQALLKAEPSAGQAAGAATAGAAAPDLRILTFESDVDPFEFSRLGSGHFVLFRKVWREGERHVQGLLIEARPFLEGSVQQPWQESALSPFTRVTARWRGSMLRTFGTADGGSGSAPLYRTRLSAPMGDLELVFSAAALPAAPGAGVVTWTAVILALVLGGGFLMMYRLGAGQIRLARQQQDFVSAVSHELKTPLTSIRMYGEMLREGWAPEEKKKEYYSFIHDESERLTRLINNVLQLARMTHGNLAVDRKPAELRTLLDTIRSKVSSQVTQAGFRLTIHCQPEAENRRIDVDQDHLAQIMINLVDNALKFSAKAERREIEIGCRLEGGARVVFSVRDYGPGIPRNQIKKIFGLFYRAENALTRETTGAGIGLALVNRLARAMDGSVDVVNQDTGVEFRVAFPVRGG